MKTPPWPHAPPHWLNEKGSYFVTASCYHRERRFDTPDKLNAVMELLVASAEEFGWGLRAWAILANHYHFLAQSPEEGGESLRGWLREFHRKSAIRVNEMSETPGRRVWMNFRESLITHNTSYLARLRYVNENPVKHGVARVAKDYRWCSAAWFEEAASRSFVKSVERFKTDRVKVDDDFD